MLYPEAMLQLHDAVTYGMCMVDAMQVKELMERK